MKVHLSWYSDDLIVRVISDDFFVDSYALFKQFPQHKKISHLECQVPATDLTYVALQNHVTTLTCDDDVQPWLTFCHQSMAIREHTGKLLARYKEGEQLELPDYEYSSEHKLAKYQQVGMHCGMINESFAYFMEQGTGKTAVIIGVLCNTPRPDDRPLKAIVLCPKNCRSNWVSELGKFSTKQLRITKIFGNQLERVKLLLDAFRRGDEHASVVVISYDSYAAMYEVICQMPWDIAVLDESHLIKTPKSQRTKATLNLRDSSQKRFVLSGTPIGNTMIDLYTQLEFLGKGESGFTSFEAFKRFYAVYRTNESGFKSLISLQNVPFMQERLAQRSFIIRKEEAIPNLPTKVYAVYDCDMAPDQRKVYIELESSIMAEVEEMLESDTPGAITMNSVLTKLLRLAEVTSGYLKLDEVRSDDGNILVPGRTMRFKENPKLDQAVELLRELPENEKAIIWACFTENIRMISERLTAEGIQHVVFTGSTKEADREKAIHSYNHDPNVRVFLGNAAAGGVGVNLLGYPPGESDSYDTNSTLTLYYSQNWSQIHRSQSEDRNHRRGTRCQVRVVDLSTPGTIDEEIRMRVMSKKKHALEVSDLRAILRSMIKREEEL